MKICFVVFGEYDGRINSVLVEVCSFLKRYIPLEHKIVKISTNVTPTKRGDCYYADCYEFRPFEDKIPDGYNIYVCLWKALGKKTCWFGGTWGKPYSIKDAWLCSLPYDLPDCYDKVGNQWNYRLTQRIIHEILNAMHGMGVITKSPEKCTEYGYDDPELGWKNCYIECLKTYNMGEWKEVWSDKWNIEVEGKEGKDEVVKPFQPDIVVESYLNKVTKATEGKISCGYINIKGKSEKTVKVRATIYLNDKIATLDGNPRQTVFDNVSEYKSCMFDMVFDSKPGKYTVKVVVEQWVD